ncbi:hypothetical protein J6590_025741, partial [Homalodisca vitripennis]
MGSKLKDEEILRYIETEPIPSDAESIDGLEDEESSPSNLTEQPDLDEISDVLPLQNDFSLTEFDHDYCLIPSPMELIGFGASETISESTTVIIETVTNERSSSLESPLRSKCLTYQDNVNEQDEPAHILIEVPSSDSLPSTSSAACQEETVEQSKLTPNPAKNKKRNLKKVACKVSLPEDVPMANSMLSSASSSALSTNSVQSQEGTKQNGAGPLPPK